MKPNPFFINYIFANPPRTNSALNETDVYHFDNTWSMALLDLENYGPVIKKSYIYGLTVIDV